MIVQPQPPAALQHNPATAGIHLVYSRLQESDCEGQAVYFATADTHPRKPAFLVGLTGQAYLGIHASSLPHSVEDGILMLRPGGGAPAERSPLGSLAARVVGISRYVGKHLNYRIYVIPVAVLIGEDPGPEVADWAANHSVSMLHGVDDLANLLSGVVRNHDTRIDFPPTGEEIDQVMELFRSREPSPVDAPPSVPGEGMDLELTARQVVIHHATTVNIYTVGAGSLEAG